jgi:hypothetical protein
MFGVARLLDAVAEPVRRGHPPGHGIVAGAVEIAQHVTTHLARELRADA